MIGKVKFVGLLLIEVGGLVQISLKTRKRNGTIEGQLLIIPYGISFKFVSLSLKLSISILFFDLITHAFFMFWLLFVMINIISYNHPSDDCFTFTDLIQDGNIVCEL